MGTQATFASWQQLNYRTGLTWTSLLQQPTPQVFQHFKRYLLIVHLLLYPPGEIHLYSICTVQPLTPPLLFLGNQSQSCSTVDRSLQRHDSARRRASALIPSKTSHLVISGGDGYEDFRLTNSSETVGRDDSTNHLLLWRVWDNEPTPNSF